MSIHATCPDCHTAYDLADHLGGRRVRCAQCGGTFDAPAAPADREPLDVVEVADEPPVRAGGAIQTQPGHAAPRGWEPEEAGESPTQRRSDKDEEDRPRRQTRTGLIVSALVGGLLGLLLLNGASNGLKFLLSRPSGPPARGGDNEALAEAMIDRGNRLLDQGQVPEAEAAFREALRLKPRFPQAQHNLGIALEGQKDLDGAVAAYERAIALDRKYAKAHNNLGTALRAKGDLDGAIAAWRKAIDIDPKHALAHNNLGNALHDQGDLDGAIAAWRQAIALDPKYAPAHYNLGLALADKGDLDGAIAAFRQAIELDPKDAPAHGSLGNALCDKKDVDGAIAEYRQAIALDPKDAKAHNNLGGVLRAKGDLEGAIAAFRQAIELDPNYANAHNSLGTILYDKQDLDGATAAYRTAIALDPKLAYAHKNLGLALYYKRDLEGAIAALRAAVNLRPDDPEAHCHLGNLLREQGRFALALEELRRGHHLGIKHPGWPYPSAAWVRECERIIELERRLPAILAGGVVPAGAAERVELVVCLVRKRLTATAARLAAEFLDDPRLSADERQDCLYYGAVGAVLAAAGEGDDARLLADKVAVMLRRQALRWLRSELAAEAEQAAGGGVAARGEVRRLMMQWRHDSRLASVRDREAQGHLPDDERGEWRRLWADVDALREKAATSN
jgi:predicted Zn finger-like uncharacterized protein